MTITTDDGKPCEGLEQGPFEPIAVIGLAAMMPDAQDLESFWQNIIDSHVSIKEIREGRWPGPVNHFWAEGKPGDIAHGYTYAKSMVMVFCCATFAPPLISSFLFPSISLTLPDLLLGEWGPPLATQ